MAQTVIHSPKAKVPSGGTVSSTQVAKTATNVNFDQATQDFLNSNFGSIAAWYNDPSIGPVLKSALTAGKNGTALQGQAYTDYIKTHAVDASGNVVEVKPEESWFGTHGKAVRDAMAQKISDVGTYNQNVKNTLDSAVTPVANELGLNLPAESLNKVAEDAYVNGWTTTDQIKAALTAQYHYDPTAKIPGGTIGKTISDLSAIASNYGIPLPKDPAQMETFIKGIIAPGNQNPALGGNAEQIFTQYAKDQAKSLFPWMSAAIDAGIAPKTYLQPFATTIANTLDISPDQVNWQDPKWQGLLVKTDPAKPGLSTQANMSDVMNKIKTDPQYGYDYTNAAKNDAANLASQIKQMFGFQGETWLSIQVEV